MKPVRAPSGFEGTRHWDDGLREWVASWRLTGETWWTRIPGGCGHAYLLDSELDARAEAQIARDISVREPTCGYVAVRS